MADTPNDTTNATAPDDGNDARADAIHVLARAMWRERLLVPAGTAEGDDAKLDKGDWKDKRREYTKLATRLFKRLERQGATLTAAARDADEEGEAA